MCSPRSYAPDVATAASPASARPRAGRAGAGGGSRPATARRARRTSPPASSSRSRARAARSAARRVDRPALHQAAGIQRPGPGGRRSAAGRSAAPRSGPAPPHQRVRVGRRQRAAREPLDLAPRHEREKSRRPAQPGEIPSSAGAGTASRTSARTGIPITCSMRRSAMGRPDRGLQRVAPALARVRRARDDVDVALPALSASRRRIGSARALSAWVWGRRP